ncbi:ras GTPase-activating protein-binding protein 2 [Cydia amplana]|uniref:ras GTPase-activating protein-binding protein 2 n=1 Tax=Cydia amplana TaxID=1869771 RepID=UPI002FE59840
MVMEATPSPSPQSVGREFVRQYYTLLNKAPTHLHRFYNNYSSFVHGGLDAPHRETLPVVGQKQIHNRIQQLNFRDCHAKISQVDSQATLGNGVVVQVTGELSNGGAPMRRFTQTFVLAAQSPKKYYVHNDIFRYQVTGELSNGGAPMRRFTQTFVLAAQSPKKYYVHNDIFRYQDLVAEDEEPGSPAEPAGYFPPPPFPPAFPAPPALDEPQLNGHQPERLHAAAPAAPAEPEPEPVAPPAAVAAPSPEPAPAPEPEPREPTPPPAHQPQPVVPPEPKTYANLLKSSAPVSAPGPAPAPAAGPAPAPLEPRPRVPRPPRDLPPNEGGRAERGPRDGDRGGDSRRYSDSQQLFLGNVPPSATEEELRALFSRFGPVAELRVLGRAPHPHYGFLTYESAKHAQDCLGAQPLYFPADSPDGVKLNVEEKKARGSAPRDGRDPPRRRPSSSHRAFPAPPRQPYRR